MQIWSWSSVIFPPPEFFPVTRCEAIERPLVWNYPCRSVLREPWVLRESLPITISPMKSTTMISSHSNNYDGYDIDYDSLVFQLGDDDFVQADRRARDVDFPLQVQIQIVYGGPRQRCLREPNILGKIGHPPTLGPSSLVARRRCLLRDTYEAFDPKIAWAAQTRAVTALFAMQQLWREFRDSVGISLCALADAEQEGWYNEELAYAEHFVTTLGKVYSGSPFINRSTLIQLHAGPGWTEDEVSLYVTTLFGDADSINILDWALTHSGDEFHNKCAAAAKIQKWWLSRVTLFSPKDLVDSCDSEYWLSQQPMGCQDSWERWLRAKFIQAHPGCDDPTDEDNYNVNINNGLLQVHHFIESLRPWQYTYFLMRSGFVRTYPDALVPRLRPTLAEMLEFTRAALRV